MSKQEGGRNSREWQDGLPLPWVPINPPFSSRGEKATWPPGIPQQTRNRTPGCRAE